MFFLQWGTKPDWKFNQVTMPLSSEWFKQICDTSNDDVYDCLVLGIEIMEQFFTDLCTDDYNLFLEHLVDLKEDVRVCKRTMKQYSIICNEFIVRVVRMLPCNISRKLNPCEGCCAEIFKKMLMLRNEKRNEWNEVEYKKLDRSIFILSSDAVFMHIVEAHEILYCASHLLSLVNPKIQFVHSTLKMYNGEMATMFATGKCVFTKCKCG